MNKQLYIKTCRDCGKAFRTDNEKATACDSCIRYRKPNIANMAKRKKKTLGMSINSVLRIQNIYNTVNKKSKHYGDIVSIIENTSSDRCVCCGDIISDGKIVCLMCESGV